MKEKVHCSLPCTKCGECCRHGGECIFRGWGPVGTPIEFEGDCQFLGEDSLCEKLVEAGNNSQFDLARFVPGKCDWPAQFLRRYHPDTYDTLFPKEEMIDDPES